MILNFLTQKKTETIEKYYNLIKYYYLNRFKNNIFIA
jgi:hypothetical protein